eukprot:CAMPEP_0183708476 /NCGR_PEP_ID=MMETSP0737-20130205/4793_1 /TAXON_ID=385413 /ORGANISM="Thalassiosira miniscula, Strain CCMP1093" /LENGTH=614 /DNA_ID=CAMNT_0025936369 /DNA_START=108 /DNA_END=1952 /DNA_ORIENTATION=-
MTPTKKHFSLVALAAGSLFLFVATITLENNNDGSSFSFLRSNHGSGMSSNAHRRLTAMADMTLTKKLTKFHDPKTVTLRKERSMDVTRSLKSENNEADNKALKEETPPLLDDNKKGQKQQQLSIKDYTLETALSIFDYYDAGAALFVYDPAEDKFNVLYPDGMIWEESRFIRIRTWIFHSLRLLFPERFTPTSPELVLPIASMDYPQVNFDKYDCFLDHASSESCVPPDFPPVLQFGSVFKLPKIPSTVPMPMPERNHLGSFHHYLVNHREDVYKLYTERRAAGNRNGLVFGETIGLKWDDLIPQVVWRATDRVYLRRMNELRRPKLFGPGPKDVRPELVGTINPDLDRNATVRALMDDYDELVPRWKGVVWTARAEYEAELAGDGTLPWCNIKFASNDVNEGGGGGAVDDSAYYEQFMEHGIPAMGERMDLETLAKYKYHMDIGGGGGTTWSGTFEKLAMPGVLFHHETLTKDYNHAKIQPWVHYIPLQEDLKDLKQKYEWAESHPEEARAISDRATKFLRHLGTQEGFGEFFREFYEGPLRKVLDAYQPVPSNGKSWQEVAKASRGLRPMIKCEGHGDFESDCKDVDENEAKRRRSPLREQLGCDGGVCQYS